MATNMFHYSGVMAFVPIRLAPLAAIFFARDYNLKEIDMVSSHATALQSKHAGLDRMLQEEQSRPAPDDTTIKRLKKEKLRLKEELAAL